MKQIPLIFISALLGVTLFAGSALADFGFGGITTVPSGWYGGGTFYNSLLGNSSFDESAADNLENNLSGGDSAVVMNSVSGSKDTGSYYIGFYDIDDVISAFGATTWISFDDVEHDSEYVYYNAVNVDGTTDSSNKLRMSVSDGNIVIETSTDGGSTWSTIPVSKTLTYAEFLAQYGQNSDAAVASRQDKARIASRMTSQMISTRLLNVFSPKPAQTRQVAQKDNTTPFTVGYTDISGLSAGNAPYQGLGVWGMGALAHNEVTKSGYKSESNLGLFMIGVDKLLLNDKLVIGLGGGYENSWSKLTSNGRTEEGEGFALSPYAAYRVTEDFIVKAALNAAWNSYDANNDAQDYDGQRLMGDISGEYSWLIDEWLLAAEAGYMCMGEDFDHDYTDVYLNEGRISGKVGYQINEKLLPYMRLTYFQELASSAPSSMDDKSMEVMLGLDYSNGPWIMSVTAFDNFNDDQNTIGGTAMLRYEF